MWQREETRRKEIGLNKKWETGAETGKLEKENGKWENVVNWRNKKMGNAGKGDGAGRKCGFIEF